MLNGFAKFMLVATSLSPLLGAVAVNQLALGKPVSGWLPWLAVGFLLVFVCWALLRHLAASAQSQLLRLAEFERNDQEVLAFLVTYLLPFISAKDIAFPGQWLTGAYILAVIFLVIAHAGAFHFNPVMGLLGYHFYGIKNGDGVSLLLISKAELHKPGVEVRTVRLAPTIYLHTGGEGA